MPAEVFIVSFPVNNDPDRAILFKVRQKSGGSDLDLHIIATNADKVWRTRVQERKVSSLREESYDGTEQQWRDLVNYTLTQRGPFPANEPDLKQRLHVVCEISDSGTKLKLIIRTKVNEIVHKLGTVVLIEGDSEEENLFDWALAAVSSRDALSSRVEKATVEAASYNECIEEMKARLESLTTERAAYEQEVLSKFTLLLNEKKLKIRMQQRQLVENATGYLEAVPKKTAQRNEKRRTSRRKRPAESEDDSDAFEPMEIDANNKTHPAELPVDDSNSQQTSTASENEDDPDPMDLIGRASQVASTVRQPATPPRRHLPFATGNGRLGPGATVPSHDQSTGSKTQEQMSEQEETASEDDEL